MDLRIVVALVLFAFITVGSALDCYHCTSGESWGLCLKNKYVKECNAWEDRCFKASVDTYYDDSRVIRYSRGCATDKKCYDETLEDCKGGDDKSYSLPCDVYCCSGELCNGASSPAVSGVMTCAVLVTYTVLAFVFW